MNGSVFVFGLMLSATGSAQSSEPQEAASGASEDLTPLELAAVDDVWVKDHKSGQLQAVGGLVVSGVGMVASFTAVSMVMTSILSLEGIPEQTVLLLYGGSALILAGTPLATAGVSHSHRALASVELVNEDCWRCRASWISMATAPLTAVIGFGTSCGFVAAQHKENRSAYRWYVRSRQGPPQVRLSPILSTEVQGLSLSGSF